MEFNTQKQVIILRGPSGSGKSTKAKELVSGNPDSIIHSTDDYFMVNGEYKFDPAKLHLYHTRNYNAFLTSLSRGISFIVVDNTNLSAWEYEKYVNAAKQHGYSVTIYDMPLLDPEVLAKRNIHGVPLEKIKVMVHKYKNSLEENKIKKFMTNFSDD